jgi:hypothetical protein
MTWPPGSPLALDTYAPLSKGHVGAISSLVLRLRPGYVVLPMWRPTSGRIVTA